MGRFDLGLSPRNLILLGLLLAVLIVTPWFAGDYFITILILIFYFAYVGQAWNVMMGFAGQLSLGHALYVGLAGYLAALLFKDYGIGPWLGFVASIPVTMLAGAIIGFLALRFGVTGVYFAILTIAFAEFARIGFDHLSIVNGSGGFFLPVASQQHVDLWSLRGPPIMFYYVMLAAAVAALIACRLMLNSRMGYYWLAIREDEEAARAVGINTFAYKMTAVVISAGMTAFGGIFYAFYYNNLFPEQVFHISRSIELIVGPIIGGLGTLLGPIIGAFLLTGLAESLNGLLAAVGIDIPGARQVLYGVCLFIVIVALPGGVWPWLARHLRLTGGGR